MLPALIDQFSVLFIIVIFIVSVFKEEGISFVDTKNYDPKSKLSSSGQILRYSVFGWGSWMYRRSKFAPYLGLGT